MGSGASKPVTVAVDARCLQVYTPHDGGINCMAVSVDGSVLVTGGEDAVVQLWAVGVTTKTENIGILRGHQAYITCVQLHDKFVLSGSADRTVRKWDSASCECMFISTGHYSSVSRLVCTNKYVFSTSYDRDVRCWDMETGFCVRLLIGHKKPVTPITYVMSVAEHSTARVEERNSPDSRSISSGDYDYSGQDTGEWIITGSVDCTARAWSVATGNCMAVYRAHTGAITCLCVEQEGTVLYTGSADNSIISWRIATGRLVRRFEGHNGLLLNLTINNEILYSASSDHTARSWLKEKAEPLKVYTDHTMTVTSVQYANQLVYTACGDNKLRCFDAKEGDLMSSFLGHTNCVTDLMIIGTRVYSVSADGTVRVWDVSAIKPHHFVSKTRSG